MTHETAAAPLTITDLAATRLKEVLEREKRDPATTGLRLGVQGGGCSGFQYAMDFDTPTEEDVVVERGGVKLIVDPRSLQHLKGTVLDWQEGLMGSGFAIKNPNVKGSCGCGQSFSV